MKAQFKEFFTQFSGFNPFFNIDNESGIYLQNDISSSRSITASDFYNLRFGELKTTPEPPTNYINSYTNWHVEEISTGLGKRYYLCPYNVDYNNLVDLTGIIKAMQPGTTQDVEIFRINTKDNLYQLIYGVNITKSSLVDNNHYNITILQRCWEYQIATGIKGALYNRNVIDDPFYNTLVYADELWIEEGHTNSYKIRIDCEGSTTQDFIVWHMSSIVINDDNEYTGIGCGYSLNTYPYGGVEYSTTIPTRNGYYKGLPTTYIDQREFIRKDINYLKTLDIYDETKQRVNSAFLNNRVGTLNYNGVNFAYPNIIIQAKTSLQFTHVVTASWSDDNRPVVYKVVKYRNLGKDLNEYTLAVDGLKTFFQHNGITTKNPICRRCTDADMWDKWSEDLAEYDGTYTRENYTGPSAVPIYCLNLGEACYGLTASGWEDFCYWIVNNEYQNSIITQITRVFIAPYTGIGSQISASSHNHITFNAYREGVHRSEVFTPTDGTVYEVAMPTGNSSNLHSVYIGTQINYNENIIKDMSDVYHSNATIHIPFYGEFTPSAEMLLMLRQNPLQFKLILSPSDGTISVCVMLEGKDGVMLPTTNLPSLTVPYDGSVASIVNANNQLRVSQENQVSSMINGTLAGAGTGLALGLMGANPFTATAGAIGGATVGLVNGFTSLESAKNSAQANIENIRRTQGVHSITASGSTAMSCPVTYLSIAKPVERMSKADLYEVIGYPVNKPLVDVGTQNGCTYWLEWNTATLRDNSEIVNDLILQSRNGIYWNA